MNIAYLLGLLASFCSVAGVAFLYRLRKKEEVLEIETERYRIELLGSKHIAERQSVLFSHLWNLEDQIDSSDNPPAIKMKPYAVGTKFHYSENLNTHNSNEFNSRTSSIGKKKA